MQDIVSPGEGRVLADVIGADYYETSVWAPYGVDDVFDNVARSALCSKRLKNIFSVLNLKNVRKPKCQAPYQLPHPSPPSIKVEDPTLDKDMKKLLESSTHSDVVFNVQGVWMRAHRICLMASSPVFEDLFLLDCPTPQDSVTIPTDGYSNVKCISSSHHKLLKDTTKLIDNDEPPNLIDLSACAAPTSAFPPPHKTSAFISVQVQLLDDVAQSDVPQKLYQTIVTLNSCITPAALQAVLVSLI